MAALITVLVVMAFVVLDQIWSRRAARVWGAGVPVPEEPVPATPGSAVSVSGFEFRPGLRYHPGHTWARFDEKGLVTIGLDDFARRLVGQLDQVELPCGGSTLLQGEVGFRVGRDGRWVDVLSPVDGEVAAVNRALLAAPDDVSDDPYGRGWICRVRPRNVALTLRNLLGGTLAQRWIEDEAAQLQAALAGDSGGAMADGGTLAPDYERHLDPAARNALAKRFLLREEPGGPNEEQESR